MARTPDSPDAPQIIRSRGALSKNDLLDQIVHDMTVETASEDELVAAGTVAAAFVRSLVAVAEREVGDGYPVNLFNLVTIQPRLHTAGKRQVDRVYGEPESGKTIKRYPAKVDVRASVGRRLKAALPSIQRMRVVTGPNA